jgi:enoyl-CoA hydratase/carnithine racemase
MLPIPRTWGVNSLRTFSAMADPVIYERRGAAAVLIIDRPERRNAIDGPTAELLTEGYERFVADDGARVLVIAGAGDAAFCAGADLKAIETFGPRLELEDGPLGFSRLISPKPAIAAISGWCLAGGLELALWCDLRVATEDAKLGFTERRFGVPLIDGGTQRLPRIVGMGRAMELIITGRVITAAEAERIGLVNEVTPRGSCVTRALELAGEIAALPQPAIRTDKEAAVRGYGRPLEEGLRIEAQCFNELLSSPEMAEGVRRFVERDHPDRDASGETVTPGLVRGGKP